MASNIDVTKPETGAATTQSVRDNFQAAKTEIEALQTDPVIVDTAVIQSDDATAAAAPFLTLYRNSATPAASDLMGLMRFSGENSAAEQVVYGAVQSILSDPTDGAEDGALSFKTMQGGTLAEVLLIDSDGNGAFAGDLTIAGTLNLTAGALSVDDLTVTTDVTFAGATVADLGTVTTADINGGTIDGTVIGGTTAAAATVTDLSASGTVTVPDGSFTIAKTTGLQAALDLKAPLASPTFTGTVTVPTADINGGAIDGTVIGGATPAAGSFTTFTSTGIDDNATSTAITINASENVGIGTVSPDTNLHVEGANPVISVESNVSGGWLEMFASSSATGPLLAWSSGNSLRFGAGPSKNLAGFSEFMRIDSSGNLLVGTTSLPTGAADGHSITAREIRASITGTSAVQHYRVYNSNGQVGSISSLGTTTNFNTSSDVRLKENIQDASPVTPIDSLQVRQFDWKADGAHQDYGFIAQELNEFFPEAVSQGETWGVDNSKLVPMMVKELQQLRARVATLEAQ